MSVNLTQQEADTLLSMDKYYLGTDRFDFPSLGGSLRIPLHSADKREEFSLDINKGRIELRKHSMQMRTRKIIILVRLDISGAPHRNPDGQEIQGTHIHIYKEGFDDKWAEAIPNYFSDTENVIQTLQEFMDYCHITAKPQIEYDIWMR